MKIINGIFEVNEMIEIWFLLWILVGWGWGGVEVVEEFYYGASFEEYEFGFYCFLYYDFIRYV